MDKELNQFKEQGYCILENQNINAHNIFLKTLSKSIGIEVEQLQLLHEIIDDSNINNLRLNAFSDINSLDLKNDLYFSQAHLFLTKLLGPDVSIQNKLNLSIQLPFDDSSLLPLHTDTISGQSAFEVVLWTPFTRCLGNNSMFIIPIQKSQEMMAKLKDYRDLGMKKLEEDYKDFMHFIEILPNQVLVFSPTLFHGNVVNTTSQTRISLNCRFKNIFAPESPNPERRLGTFYQVFKTSALTEIALSYKDPYISSL